MRRIAFALLLAASAAQSQPKGKLVVLVVVDQLRFQDLLWLKDELGPQGFAGLGQPVPARYDTVNTETAPDHATLGTGTYPDVHGVVANRTVVDGKEREMVEDAACPTWNKKQAASARTLLAPTVGDALKLASNGRSRVLSVAFKDRSALFLAGPSADLALFWDIQAGEMTSTTCHAPAAPGWFAALQKRHPAAEWKDWVWTPSRPEPVYARHAEERTTDVVEANGIGAAFPHRVGQGDVSPRLFRAIRATPAQTTISLRTARAGVEGLELGDRGTTDLLLLSLSALDYVGHFYGGASRERVDTVLRLHDELRDFFAFLRKRLGDRVAVVLTSDHGVTPPAGTSARVGLRAVRIETADVEKAVRRSLDQAFGERPDWIAAVGDGQLTLRRFAGVDPARVNRVAAEALRAVPGIWRAVAAEDVEREEQVVRHSFRAGRSGDVLFVPGPLATVYSSAYAASHGSPWNDDALVPILAQAPGFRLRRGQTLDVTQIAPAVALLSGIAPPAAAFAEPALVPVE